MEAHEFIVGKWYKSKDGRYAKFSKLSNALNGEPNYYFHWSEWLNKDLDHEYYNGSWYRTDMEKEADMSIIACRLPYYVNSQSYEIY